MPADSIAGPLVPVAAVTAGVLVCLRLGGRRPAARVLDAAAVTAIAVLLTAASVAPERFAGVVAGGLPEGRPSACVVAAAIAGMAFAWQSALKGLRGLAVGSTGCWAAVGAVATTETPVLLCLALTTSAWLVWGETARQEDTPRPVLATRRLVLTSAADLPFLAAVAMLRSRGLDLPWDAVTVNPGLVADPVWSLVCVGLLCAAAARIGLFPLSLWRARTAALGRGPAAVVGPILSMASGTVLLARFGPLIAADPVAEALKLALPASALALALIAASQTNLRSAVIVAAALIISLLSWKLVALFDVAAAAVLLASAAVLFMADPEKPVRLLPDGELRRLGRRQFYFGEVATFMTLPIRGFAQLTRFFDGLLTVPAVTVGWAHATAALDAEMDAESTGRRVGVLPIVLLAAAVVAAWGGFR